jgi:NAD(P)-dependent dehydrogenase (short-subunit alcohol dehydrogenase family)
MEKKYAVVTGASRGLGVGVSEALAKNGFHVFVTGRGSLKLQETFAKLKKDNLSVESYEMDVSSPGSINSFCDTLVKKIPHLDVLVNNAGVFLDAASNSAKSTAVSDVSFQTVLETFQVNSLGPYIVTQRLLPLIAKSPGGRIVNVSSGMGGLSEMGPGYPAYRMSKTALNAFTKLLSQELKNTKIKVNSVCPGWVKTDMGGANATRELGEGVQSIIWAALLPEDGPTGGYFRDGKSLAW